LPLVASEIAAGSAARANGADRQLSGQDEAPCNRFWLPEQLASSAFTSPDVCWLTAARSSGSTTSINSYYDPELKKARLAELAAYPNFHFQQCDAADRAAMAELFAAYRFESVIHLAAQAGVRYSLVDPHAYADANVLGFLNILEGCRHAGCKHLIYASSSSVYGANTHTCPCAPPTTPITR
jgi:nucleoside-diphosphate-sugar epimerase